MGRKTIDMTGRIYGNLTVLSRAGKADNGETLWLCKCACGNAVSLPGARLRSGHATTCGHCLRYRKQGNCVIGTDYKGNCFIFDASDFGTVSAYRWWVASNGYVVADNSEGHRIRLHRLLMGNPTNSLVDHINGNK